MELKTKTKEDCIPWTGQHEILAATCEFSLMLSGTCIMDIHKPNARFAIGRNMLKEQTRDNSYYYNQCAGLFGLEQKSLNCVYHIFLTDLVASTCDRNADLVWT